MKRLIAISIFMITLCSAPTLSYAQDDCTGLVQPRLGVGVTARAAFNDGLGVVFRTAPGTDDSGSEVIENFPEGVIFTVTGDAPICQDGFVWWAVQLPDGRSGFMAEGAAATGGYFAEPFEIAVTISQPSATNPGMLDRYLIDSRGNTQQLSSFAAPTQPIADFNAIWQETEIATAQSAYQNLAINCPDQIPSDLSEGIESASWATPPTEFIPAPDGASALVIRDYRVTIPDCTGAPEQYGTSTVSVLSTTGTEELVFPFSQHSDPPLSSHCQPPFDPQPDAPTAIMEVEWSQDSEYVAVVVRYLRDGENFPCAFYHIFTIHAPTLDVFVIGEGRRVGWGQGGRRLRFVRVERQDPNAAGTERLLSVLPDGGDPIEIFIPGGATWLPDATLQSGVTLPWTERGDKLLVCNGRVYNCGETLTFQIIDSGFVNPIAILAPSEVQLGLNLQQVEYVAGDTQLLWLNTEGTLYLQPIAGDGAGQWTEVSPETLSGIVITEIVPLPSGVGAVLVSDASLYYLDVLTNTASIITLP